jgi:transcription elongation GreA/GreB family factor
LYESSPSNHCLTPAMALRKESRNNERGLHPGRKRRNGRGGRAAGSPHLAASGRTAYDAAQRIEDAGERRRAVAVASRDMRYFVDRLRTAQLVPPPAEFSAVAFGHRVAFRRDDGRLQAFRIVGEDEADPRNGSISHVSPVARALIGRAAGHIVLAGDHEIEILSVD